MKLNSSEIKSTVTIAVIVSARLLGIFLILPVFSVYTVEYPHANLTLAGIAFGIYALTQSLLQIPMGWASDRYGRKNILILGLLLFSVGSLICGFADNIYELIIARAIQGSGAVGSVAIASLGDSTRPEVRAQAFTITGIIIGVAFVISLVIGPLLAGIIGFKSLFFILSGLGVFGILITLVLFPAIEKIIEADDKGNLFEILKSLDFRILLISAFILSFCLNLFLFIYPLSWQELNTPPSEFWLIYLIILIPSGLFVYPYIRISEKRKKLNTAVSIGFVFIVLGFLFYYFNLQKELLLYLSGMAFFLGHTLYQSILPTFLTQRVSSQNRGSTSGFYNLANFFGASLGGMFAGFLFDMNSSYPIIMTLGLLMLWLIIGLPKQPQEDSIS